MHILYHCEPNNATSETHIQLPVGKGEGATTSWVAPFREFYCLYMSSMSKAHVLEVQKSCGKTWEGIHMHVYNSRSTMPHMGFDFKMNISKLQIRSGKHN